MFCYCRLYRHYSSYWSCAYSTKWTKPSTTGTPRKYSKTPRDVGRWEGFKAEASSYQYPTDPIGADVVLPATTEIKFKLERDVDKVIGSHLDNFNRIFRDLGKYCPFESKVDAFLPTPGTASQDNLLEFIGVPDSVLTLHSKVLTFIEDKTPNDLPVRHRITGQLFDLLGMYQEDSEYKSSSRVRGDIGRMDVCIVIDQVYGYMSLNNLIYGCVTCYDVTYFLWRPKRGTLRISDPVFNGSRSPTLLQALYYSVELALLSNETHQQKLESSPLIGVSTGVSTYESNSNSAKPETAGSNFSSVNDGASLFIN